MNYLELVQHLRRKARIAGGNPATLQGQPNEEMQRLMAWINEAVSLILALRSDWPWLRARASFQTIDGQAEYSLSQAGVADLGAWDECAFRCYPTSGGLNNEMPLSAVSYDYWRDVWQIGASRTQRSQPVDIAILPDYGLALGPTPAAGYTITGEYFRQPAELTADTDVPPIPAQYHWAIIYRAMMLVGASEAAAEVYQEGEAEYRRLAQRMIGREQRHDFGIGGALA